MASSTGSASAAPPAPCRKARRSIFNDLLIGFSAVSVCSLLLLEEKLVADDIADHVLHPVAVAGLSRSSVLLEIV